MYGGVGDGRECPNRCHVEEEVETWGCPKSLQLKVIWQALETWSTTVKMLPMLPSEWWRPAKVFAEDKRSGIRFRLK